MPQKRSSNPTDAASNRVQGEGDYASARHFDEAQQQFVKEHDTQALAREAEPQSQQEAREMSEAEDSGRARAKPTEDGQTVREDAPRRRGRFLRRRR